MKKDALRILDVNLNRVREGLRVCEDILRFFFENEVFTQRIKELRHEIFGIINSRHYASEEFINSRDVENDKTKYNNPVSEFDRTNIVDVFKSNFQRVKEALRVLEEIMKLDDIDSSKKFKRIRFKVYDLEKEFHKIIDKSFSNHKFDINKFNLYPILDLDSYKSDITKVVNSIISVGIGILQLRSKTFSDRDFFQVSKKIKSITSKKKVLLIINDRVDLSMAIDADGVHLGQKDLSVCATRKLIGENKIIGISTHNLEQIQKANQMNVDYISVGPIFNTSTKSDLEPLGVTILDKVNSTIDKPLIGIGGINQKSIEKLYGKNLTAVAVVSAILSSKSPGLITQKLMIKAKDL